MGNRAWWNLEPHGTLAAYRRHRRHGEKPCRLCLDASNADSKRRYRERQAAAGKAVRESTP